MRGFPNALIAVTACVVAGGLMTGTAARAQTPAVPAAAPAALPGGAPAAARCRRKPIRKRPHSPK